MSRSKGVEYVVPAEWLRGETEEQGHGETAIVITGPENVHTRSPFALPQDPEGIYTNAEGPGLSDQNQR
jgi:hypothetical protein